MLLAAAAILGGVVVVAMGRGGELALFDRDAPVKVLRLASPGEVANLKLPLGLVGYQTRAAGEALAAAADLLARRDAEIAALRREIWRLGGDDQLVVPEESGSGHGVLDFAAPDLAEGLGAGGNSYSSASLAAWYESIAQAGSRGDDESGSESESVSGSESASASSSEFDEEAPVAADLDQKRAEELDETSRLEQDSRS